MSSSIACPKCTAENQADFGVVTCSNCHVVFFVNIDGTVTLPDDPVPSTVEPNLDSTEYLPDQSQLSESQLNSPTDNYIDSQQGNVPEFQAIEASPDQQDSHIDIAPVNAFVFQDDIAVQKNDPLPKETFQDVVDFAESESGAISFDLHIDRIDNREKIDLVLGVLKEPRLKFEIRDLKVQLVEGKVKLTSINAAKLVFILKALGHQGLSLVWEQKVYEK